MNTVTDTRPLPAILWLAVVDREGARASWLTANAALNMFERHGRAFIEVTINKGEQGRSNNSLHLWILLPDGVIHIEELDANKGTPREQAAAAIAACNERMFYQTCESGGLI